MCETGPTMASLGLSRNPSRQGCCLGIHLQSVPLSVGMRILYWCSHWTALHKQIGISFLNFFLYSNTSRQGYCISKMQIRTQPALVFAGACWALNVKLKKYSGIDNPRKIDTPAMKRLRIEFMLVNCKNDSPTAAAKENKWTKNAK